MKRIATAIAAIAALAAGEATADSPPSPSTYGIEVDLQPESGNGYSVVTNVAFALPLERNELVLDFEGSAVDGATAVVNKAPWPLSWSWNKGGKGLLVELRKPLPTQGSLILEIRSRGSYGPPGGEGLVIYGEGAEAIYSTQFQPQAARDVFPSIDHPAHPASFELTLVTRKEMPLFSNTPVAQSVVLKDGKIATRFEPTSQIPTYLLAFAGGALTASRTRNLGSQATAVRLARPTSYGKYDDRLFTLIEEVIGQFEDEQLTLPSKKLDIVLIPEFRYFGMENPGVIFLRAGLLDWASENDRWPDVKELIGHEIAHQWFGNSLAPRRWRDIWIAESFATWATSKVTGRSISSATARQIDLVRAIRRLEPPVLPSNSDIEDHPSTIFTSSRYVRGASLIDSLVGSGRPAGDLLKQVLSGEDRASLTSPKLFDRLVGQGLTAGKVSAFAKLLTSDRPAVLVVDRGCGGRRQESCVVWRDGQPLRDELCFWSAAGKRSCTPTPSSASDRPKPLAYGTIVPDTLQEGFLIWRYKDASEYSGSKGVAFALPLEARLSFLTAALLAVWEGDLPVAAAADLIGDEAAVDRSTDGDDVRALLLSSLARIDLDRGTARNFLKGLTRRGASAEAYLESHPAVRAVLETDPASAYAPDPEIAALLKNTARRKWQGREAYDFLTGVGTRPSYMWAGIAPTDLHRFAEEHVDERYWDNLIYLIGQACSPEALRLLRETPLFQHPRFSEAVGQGTTAISSCLAARSLQRGKASASAN